MLRIDGLQYANWSHKVFKEMRKGGVSAVHVTIAYHENFRETVSNMEQWNIFFEKYSDLIIHGRTAQDVELAQQSAKTAIFFGSQNASVIEEDIGLIQILNDLGLKFMQLTYNNQSLLATGCYEGVDTGLTRMGKQVVKEMNRVGMVVDMSHSGEDSTLAAIEASEAPIVISHANPQFWHDSLRSKSDIVLRALSDSGGILGFSLYPHHLVNGSQCALDEFCTMVAKTAEKFGVDCLAMGSDLCQDHPDSVVSWMRMGRWTKDIDYGEGSQRLPGFPDALPWFKNNLGFENIEQGLKNIGFSNEEIQKIMGKNWLDFFRKYF